MKQARREDSTLNEDEFSALLETLTPFCFSGNRTALYRLFADLERHRGNELLYATYRLRIIRLSGYSDTATVDELCDIFARNGFEEEASCVRMIYGPRPDYDAALAFLRETGSRYRSPPPEVGITAIDGRILDRPKVSIIVSLYNAARKLPTFLQGILQLSETTRGAAELILIDSHSPDNTQEVAARELRQIVERPDGRIGTLYVRTAVRETIQRAWNRGIAFSRGEYLAFLGADEMNRPDTFDILGGYLDRNPAVDWVQGNALVTEVDDAGTFVRDVMTYNRTFNNSVMHYLDTCYIGYVGALYRRTVHDRVGFYDDRFRAAGDTEFKNRHYRQ